MLDFLTQGPDVTLLVIGSVLVALVAAVFPNLTATSRSDSYIVLEDFKRRRQTISGQNHIEAIGRPAGLIGLMLNLFGDVVKVRLLVNQWEARKESVSLSGREEHVLPLRDTVTVEGRSRRNFLYLLLALVCFGGGVKFVFEGATPRDRVISLAIVLITTLVWCVAFFLSHRFVLRLTGATSIGISFKAGVVRNQTVTFRDVTEAVDVVAGLIRERAEAVFTAATAGPAYAPQPEPYAPAATGGLPGNGSEPPLPAGQYGEQPEWVGGEPGVSDSVRMQQNFSRPNRDRVGTGTVPDTQNYQDPGPAPASRHTPLPEPRTNVRDQEPADFGNDRWDQTPEKTMGWEEQAEQASDEERAAQELDELRKAQLTRGLAKRRLQEIMRRYPTTRAAQNARRMLERLEASE